MRIFYHFLLFPLLAWFVVDLVLKKDIVKTWSDLATTLFCLGLVLVRPSPGDE